MRINIFQKDVLAGNRIDEFAQGEFRGYVSAVEMVREMFDDLYSFNEAVSYGKN